MVPSAIKDALSKTVSQFSGNRQHDAQELMSFLRDRMHDELNRVRSTSPYRERYFNGLPTENQSEEWAKYHKSKDNSIMTDLFGGQLVTGMHCMSCGKKKEAFNMLMDLTVEIP